MLRIGERLAALPQNTEAAQAFIRGATKLLDLAKRFQDAVQGRELGTCLEEEL